MSKLGEYVLGTKEIQGFPLGTRRELPLLSTIWKGSKFDPRFQRASSIFPLCIITALPSPTVFTDGSCSGCMYGSQNKAITVGKVIWPVVPSWFIQLWALPEEEPL